MTTLFIRIQYWLPQHLMSRVLGRLAAARKPRGLITWCVRAFAKRYGVDFSEAEEPFPEAYESFNQFFTRPLKQGVRPLCDSGIACPADGVVSEFGRIDNGRLMQAKGRTYTLSDLLAGDEDSSTLFAAGEFCTVYLSPRDYHRVHMPLDGELSSCCYVPGDLFSVNQATASSVENLFARNERHISCFETPRGPMAVILVGAMIVAGIETVWQGQVAPPPRRITRWNHKEPEPKVQLNRGQEMGRFLLGSTVILLFPEGAVSWVDGCKVGAAVRVGQQIAI
ncbi:MAG: archaetidylserine decarboxylase [Pseudomonadota bacterium]